VPAQKPGNNLSMFCNFVTAPCAVPDISPIKLFLDNGLVPARIIRHAVDVRPQEG
jgi:hypothetical protein